MVIIRLKTALFRCLMKVVNYSEEAHKNKLSSSRATERGVRLSVSLGHTFTNVKTFPLFISGLYLHAETGLLGLVRFHFVRACIYFEEFYHLHTKYSIEWQVDFQG